MTGTHYTLDRDKDENQNPMDRIKEKACRTCGTVKPNNFSFFGKKLWKTRIDLTTNDVCLVCQKAKTAASMKAKWAARKQENANYDAERTRVAMATYVAQERAKAQAIADTLSDQVKAVEPLPLDGYEFEDVKPISLEDSVDLAEIVSLDSSDKVEAAGQVEVVKHVETDSERLMRELLEKP